MGRIKKAERITSMLAYEIEMSKIVHDRDVYITTGVLPVDAVIKGFRYGELILIGSRPVMGKTKYLLKSLLRISKKVPVLLCSLENNSRRVANKIISLKKDGGVSFFLDHIGKSDFVVDLNEEKLFITDCIFESMEEYILLIVQHIVNDGVKVIAIDDLHLLPESSSRLSHLEILKEVCEIFKVTIIVTSLVTQECELRGGDKKPRLKDLSIEASNKYLLDVVLLLYRPEYYGFTKDENGNSTAGKLEVIIAKDRANEPFAFHVNC
jgi:replicative DNA helicase